MLYLVHDVIGSLVGVVGEALGIQSQAILDCQLSASESPVDGQQAKDARLGGPSGRQLFISNSITTSVYRVLTYHLKG